MVARKSRRSVRHPQMSAHLAETIPPADVGSPKPIDPLVGPIALVSEIAYRFPTKTDPNVRLAGQSAVGVTNGLRTGDPDSAGRLRKPRSEAGRLPTSRS